MALSTSDITLVYFQVFLPYSTAAVGSVAKKASRAVEVNPETGLEEADDEEDDKDDDDIGKDSMIKAKKKAPAKAASKKGAESGVLTIFAKSNLKVYQ